MDASFVKDWVVVSGDEHVVHVHCQPAFSDFFLEDGVHHGLEGGGGVGHSEEHNRRFVKSFVSDEGGLPFVAFSNAHVVVSPPDVKLCKEFLHSDAVDQLGNEGKWVPIAYCPFVQASIVLYGA